VFRISVPTWPTEGQWFFNPFCWQVVFVLGFAASRERGPGKWVRSHISILRRIALPIVIAGAIAVWFRWWPDPTKVPEPKLLFIADKNFVTPLRLIQFLALIAVFSAFYPYIEKVVPRLVEFLSMLGRNSLQVFCAGSVLSLASQIVRYYFRGGFLVDTGLVAVGIVLMGVIAWLAEWRDRVKKRA
jgi:hypothetical protein